MPQLAVINRISDARAARTRERERKRALRAPEHEARRRKIVKIVLCALLIVLFLLLGFAVGTSEYQVTFIGWAPLGMTLAGIVLAAIYLAILKRSITFEEELVSSECQRDESVAFTIRLKNASPLLATRIKTTFYIADMFDNTANESSTTMSLAPFEDYSLTLDTRFEHIGNYHAGMKSITISDFFGLFAHTIENTSHRVIHVTPKIIDLDGIRFSNEAMDEATKAAKSHLADSMDYAYVREYEMGDPLKTIHWKLSARAGGYMTRLYEVYTNPSVVIIMDFYAPGDDAEDLMTMYDAVVEAAFSVGRYARKQGMDTETHFINRQGEEQVIEGPIVNRLTELVADFPPMSNDPADSAAAIGILERQYTAARGFNNIFICSANLDSEMIEAVVHAKLQRRTPTMIAVIPPSLVGKDREKYCSPLVRLESADIGYSVISRIDDLNGGL